MTIDVYYLSNSGFSIEYGGDCMIIDYFRGKLSNSWRLPSAREPAAYNSVSVLASHAHADHYNPEIFSWTKERPDIKYLLSSDISNKIKTREKEARLPDVAFIKDGETHEINGFTVKAYGSTDAGVSFHLVKDGVSIFHAGDLNYWHWSDESTDDEIREALEMFDFEMEKIKNGVDRIDVAFFPVDPRMKTDYFRGAILFCMAMRPRILIPMHFGRVFSPPPEFFSEVSEYTEIRAPEPGKKESRIELWI
ncbi:MAG: MBL fold metallo-hydrolase [Oscillospiraceae bacterium]|nr:MBL fold metallo-hydrolase [Oscillospiraceae bacterium]